MKRPYCGSTHTEQHGMMDGDFIWWLCRECSKTWDITPTRREETDDAKV